MPIRGLYCGTTYTLRIRKPMSWVVLNENAVEGMPVAMINKLPDVAVETFTSPESGYTEAASLMKELVFVEGNIRITTTGLPQLVRTRVIKRIPVEALAKFLLEKGEEISRMLHETRVSRGHVVEYEGVAFRIVKVGSVRDQEELRLLMKNLYERVSVARIQVMTCIPVFVEVAVGEATVWGVKPIPFLWYIIREAPDTVVQAGMIESGYNVPYMILRGPIELDDFIASANMIEAAMDDLDDMLRRASASMMKASLTVGGAAGGEEEAQF